MSTIHTRRPKIGTVAVGAEWKKYRLTEIVGRTAHVQLLTAKTNRPVKNLTMPLSDFNYCLLFNRNMGPIARALTDGKITKKQVRAICTR